MGDKFSFTGLGVKSKKKKPSFLSPDVIKDPGILTMNRVSVFLLLVCIIFLIPFYFNESVSLTWFFLSEAIAFALIPILAKQGYEKVAKLLLIAYIDIGIVILSTVFGDDAMIQAFFIPTMGLSILLFDAKNVHLRNISILLSVVAYFILDFIIYDQVYFSESRFSIIRWSVLTAAFVTTWLIFNTFSDFKETAEEKTTELLEKEIELNRELNIKQRKLEQNIEELEKAREELQQSTQAKSVFLATMSHEIRTPMNAIMGMTHLLQSEDPREDQQDALNILDFSGKTLLTLIDDVLDFSKIEAGRIEFEDVEFELDKLIKTIRETFKVMAKNKGITLKDSIEGDIHNALIGDSARLTQILNNLLSNALKFTEEGEVLLKAKLIEDLNDKVKIEFSVSDTGIGIPEDRVEMIFESFTQASGSTKRLYGGTGLGLTISKQLIELQGGKLYLDSEVEKGSTFYVELSFSKGEVSTNSKSASDSEELDVSTIKGIELLLAEDNVVNQKVMRRFLDRWEVNMTIVDNGREAVEMVKKNRYDIVLMDLQMPELDGYEATNAIRSLSEAQKRTVPIIALTAAALKEVKEQVFASGMNDFVTKPFNPSELQQKIIKLINK